MVIFAPVDSGGRAAYGICGAAVGTLLVGHLGYLEISGHERPQERPAPGLVTSLTGVILTDRLGAHEHDEPERHAPGPARRTYAFYTSAAPLSTAELGKFGVWLQQVWAAQGLPYTDVFHLA